MSKKLVIPTSITKSEAIAAVEKSLQSRQKSEKDYRFTAVLPESVGRRLRVYCAHNNLKLKHVLAKAVIEHLETRSNTNP